MFAFRLSACLFLLVALLGPAHGQQSFWNVEQSIVELTGPNTALRAVFRTPSGYFASQGVTAGAPLFEGERSGDQVSGLAWAYKTGCASESYEALGSFSPDGGTLTLTGREPIKDAFCKVASFRDRTLILAKQASATPPPPPPPVASTPPPAAAPASTRSLWAHNDSTLYLVVSGNSRELYYETPRPGMVTAGAEPGSLLFRGTYGNNAYSGTAYRFNKQCGPMPYQVSGPVTNNFETITMYGQAPVADANCNITRHVQDKLEFNLCMKTRPPGATVLLCPR